MNAAAIARGIGLGIAAMAANVAVAFLLVWVYSLIEPGHDEAFYQAFAQRVAPISSIVAGIPILFVAGYWSARGAGRRSTLAALLPAITYVVLDAVILASVLADALAIWPYVIASWITKLGAAWAGGRVRRPAPGR